MEKSRLNEFKKLLVDIESLECLLEKLESGECDGVGFYSTVNSNYQHIIKTHPNKEFYREQLAENIINYARNETAKFLNKAKDDFDKL